MNARFGMVAFLVLVFMEDTLPWRVLAGAGGVVLPAHGLCAHRGGGATLPENTIPALLDAVRRGVHMVEFDVSLTRDGALVLMHDRTVDRTTNGTGAVSDLTLAEIRRLDAGIKMGPQFAGVRVPTFEEALEALPRNVWINVDFKSDGRFGDKSAVTAKRVAQILVQANRLHQSFLAARADDAVAAREVAPSLRICSMDRQKDPGDYVRAAIAQRADFIQLRDCADDPRFPEWVKTLKAVGIRINYFYTNEANEVARLRAAGVDFVLVDTVEAMLASQTDLVRWVPRWK
ncbi:MAG TPA: glycerophosphodiester phosphodiesterase family protein [Opitutaceae bacterium]|nr:glycerophosphodiester phosphodiesterase family protein [Opitutaceae bacterium]